MKRIISASYKDDTPAFKSEEFFRDLKKGFRLLPGRFGTSKISLLPEDVYCFIFWTKNPSDHFFKHLNEIKSPFYVQWTISGYDNDLETKLPKKDEIVDRFILLSRLLGPERVIWRYDPILINDKYTIEEHILRFRKFYKKLVPFTTRCVISFMDEYGKIAPLVKAREMRAPSLNEIQAITKAFSDIVAADGNLITIQTCSEGKYDLSAYGVHEGACIDAELIERITGNTLPEEIKKANSFRRCNCAINTDIGSYHTCKHGCKYCYAQ